MFGFIISVFVFFQLHLWYLVQQRVLIRSVFPTVWVCGEEPSRLLQCIHIGRAECEDQRGMDVTPFLTYFIENVYHKLVPVLLDPDTTEIFQNALAGNVTEKEQALWQFVLTEYGEGQFSTKQLEKGLW